MTTVDTRTPELRREIVDDVATATLDRPRKRNALCGQLTPALRAMLPIGDLRNDVRCVVITEAGGAFCAGGGVSQLGGSKLAGGVERIFEQCVHDFRLRQRTLIWRRYAMQAPILAPLLRLAAGAGLRSARGRFAQRL